MARIRTIKPDFFTSEDIVSLSPLARLLYIATWLEADREGRFVWRLKTLKLRYLPGDECDVDLLAKELTDSGLVVTYEAGGQTFAEIPTFAKHQVINNRETASVIPGRVGDATGTREARVGDATGTREARVGDATGTPLAGRERKGREGKGIEESPSIPRKRGSVGDPPGFDTFWAKWPRKEARAKAAREWKRLAPNETLQTTILEAIPRHAATEQWRKDGGKFIPLPATWLNGRRWEDELTARAGPATPEYGKGGPLC